MAYEVLARKWRPKNFSELIGQNSVQKTLTNALKQARLYPVLLFTGPRGTGKTSSARILAKTLRCQKQKDFIPCDQCENCLLIQESRHLDVMEIDGASNNGVDAVRELRDTVNYLPSTGSWKIYIIDEVHMLSNSAFNALLKTLEEPPKHVLFIMATTESHKIPQTVLSRCQKLDFHLLPPHLIKEQLEKICKKEHVSIEEGALWLIAKQARGSLRDGQSLLDQMITFCSEGLTRVKVTEYMGLSDPQTLFQCLKALIHKQEEEMLALIQSLRTKGNEPRLFLQSLIEAVRDFLLLKKNPDNKPALVQISQQEIEEIKKELENCSSEDIHLLFDMLLKGEREMAFCYDSQLVLEVLLLRLCSAPRLESFIPLNPLFQDQKKKLKSESSFSPASFPSEDTKKTFHKAKEEGVLEKTGSRSLSVTESTASFPFERRLDFLDYLKEKDQTLTALVEQLSLSQKSQTSFCFTVPENFSYLHNKITEPSQHKVLEAHLKDFLKIEKDIKIEILCNKIQGLNLKREKQKKEKDALFKKAEEISFLKDVRSVFQAEIKSVIKKD